MQQKTIQILFWAEKNIAQPIYTSSLMIAFNYAMYTYIK